MQWDSTWQLLLNDSNESEEKFHNAINAGGE